METYELLTQSYLTTVVNEIKGPNTFLRSFFPRGENLFTESIEVGRLEGGRMMAPFTKKRARAHRVPGLGDDFETMGLPNISIARPHDAWDLFEQRMPGNPIFVTNRAQRVRQAQARIDRDLRHMNDMILNTEEWMCAQVLLTGKLEYNDATGGPNRDAFAYDFQPTHLGSNKIVLAAGDQWTSPGSDPSNQFDLAARIMNEAHGITPGVCLMPEDVWTVFKRNATVLQDQDLRRVVVGGLQLNTPVRGDGAIYRGQVYNNVELWTYSRTVEIDEAGTTVSMMPNATDIYFIATTPAAQWDFYYGAIADFNDAGRPQLNVGRRFSKTWVEKDPAQRVVKVQSRPLPVLKRKTAAIAMQVVA